MKEEYKEALVNADVNVTEAIDRCCGREELFEKLLRLFFKNENEISLMRTRVADKNYEELFSQTHALKGASGGIGLTNLYQSLCVMVEDLRVSKEDNIEAEAEAVIEEYQKIKTIVALYSENPEDGTK